MPPEDMSPDPFANHHNQHVSYSYAIKTTCDNIKDGLIKHNDRYGSSIFRPVSILSHSTAEDAIRIRIDDRIRKLQSCTDANNERELVDDLIGYLVNFRAYMSLHKPDVWGAFE